MYCVAGLTLPLITTDEGHKFGKTAKQAVWLDPAKTSPFAFYQFFLRTKDADVEMLLKLLTFETLGTVKDIMIKHSVSISTGNRWYFCVVIKIYPCEIYLKTI